MYPIAEGNWTETDLNLQLSATIAASGGATIVLSGPAQFSQYWKIRSYTTSTNNTGGTLTVYKNVILPGTQIDFTLRAENDVSYEDITLKPGESLYFVFTSCNPGDIFTIGVYGTVYSRGRRSY